MAKLISMVRIRTDRADALREKAIELTIKTKERVTEADLVNYLIDELTERLDMDKEGLFLKEEKE